MSEIDLRLVISGLNQANTNISELKKLITESGNNASEAGNKINKAFSIKNFSFTELWSGFNLLKSSITGIVNSISTFTSSANQYSLSLKGVAETSRAFGQDQLLANNYAKQLASDGLIKVTDSAQTLKFLISSGFNVSEALNVSKAFKDIGAFNNVVGDLGQAMQDAAKGTKTGSIELIENIGLTQKLSAVMKAANVDISNGIDITNNAAQRKAFYNAVIAEGAKFEGNAAKLAKDNVGIYSQLANTWEQLKIKIGNALNEAMIPLSEILKNIIILLANNFDNVIRIVGFTIGALLVPAVVLLTTKIIAMGVAITVSTGGVNLLVAAIISGLVGMAAFSDLFKSVANNASATSSEVIKLKENLSKLTDEQIRQELSILEIKIARRQADNDALYATRTAQLAELEKLQKVRAFNQSEKKEAAEKTKFLIDQNDSVKRSYVTMYDTLVQALVQRKKLEDQNKPVDLTKAQLKQISEYYNEVKFIDKNYYDWKQSEIRKEISLLPVNSSQKKIIENKLLNELLNDYNAYLFEKEVKDRLSTSKINEFRKLSFTDNNLSLIETKLVLNIEDYQNSLEIVNQTNNKQLQLAETRYISDVLLLKSALDKKYISEVEYYDSVALLDNKLVDIKIKNNEKSYNLANQVMNAITNNIDNIFNYRRQKTDDEYNLQRETDQLSYQATIKRIDDELKKEKSGGLRYQQLINEKRNADANYNKQKKALDDQQAKDNESSIDRVGNALKASFKESIKAVAAMTAAEAFKSVFTSGIPFPLNAILAPLAGAAAYAAVSAFGGMFEQGGQVPEGKIQGKSHKQGGVWINAEGNEYIINKKRVDQLGTGFFDFINFAPLNQVKNLLDNSKFPKTLAMPKIIYETGGLVAGGLNAFSDQKLDKVISLLQTNNEINTNKELRVDVKTNVDPVTGKKIVNKYDYTKKQQTKTLMFEKG